MRSIDADAMIAEYGDWYTEEGTEEGYIGTIKGIVDSMPTIEPERKKGKWIETKDSEWSGGGCYKCSHCSLGISFELFGLMTEWNYCPNCGVNMREEGEHE